MVLEDSQAFFDIIDAHDNVRGIVFGHVHQEYDRMRGAVRLLATPSTCVQFAPRSKAFRVDKQPPGFRILELAQDGRIETQVTRCEDVPAGLEVASAGY